MSDTDRETRALRLWRKEIIADGDISIDEANATEWSELPEELREYYLDRIDRRPQNV